MDTIYFAFRGATIVLERDLTTRSSRYDSKPTPKITMSIDDNAIVQRVFNRFKVNMAATIRLRRKTDTNLYWNRDLNEHLDAVVLQTKPNGQYIIRMSAPYSQKLDKAFPGANWIRLVKGRHFFPYKDKFIFRNGDDDEQGNGEGVWVNIKHDRIVRNTFQLYDTDELWRKAVNFVARQNFKKLVVK